MAGISSGTSGLALHISAPGVRPAAIAMSRFADAVTDFTPYWTDYFKPAWTEWMKGIFQSQGALTGASWVPLSEKYAAWKAAHGFAHEGILVRSGTTSAALIYPDSFMGVGIWEPSAKSLRVGARGPAIFHQLGTSKMPARPIIRPTGAFMLTLGKGLQTYVAGVWSRIRSEQSTYSGA